MPTPSRVFVALILLSTLLSTLEVSSLHASAQAQGTIIVSGDLQLLSIGDIRQGGHVTWTLTGDQATLLRMKVLHMFDEQASIPAGFAFAQQPTGGAVGRTVGNGILEEPEVAAYMNYLENQLEGVLQNYQSAQFRFVTVKAADRLERDFPADQSSSGLVGSSASTRANVVIKFIFEVRELPADRVFRQTDRAFADAVHQVFGFLAADNLNACSSNCYPFAPVRGWRVVGPPPAGTYTWPPGRFLWFGNGASPWNDTGAYPRNAANSTGYTTDGGFTELPVDLRFATTANFSFEHTGEAVPGDELYVQASLNRVTWTNLRASNDGDGRDSVDPLPTTVLGNSTFDLSGYLGQRVYLRLNFTADGDATTGGPGYFVRHLRIDAPSVYDGLIDLRETDYVIGFASFSEFGIRKSGPNVIRTPVGIVQYYYSVYNTSAIPNDTAHYKSFDFVENPQILFVLLVITAWLMGLFQDKVYERHRLRYPGALRSRATRVKWLVWIRRVALILLILFYFFPTIFGAGAFISGGAYWAMNIGAILGVSGFTWFWYERRAKLMPPEPAITEGEHLADLPPPPPAMGTDAGARAICAHCEMDIEDVSKAYTCECGQMYHAQHALDRVTCVRCGRVLTPAPPTEKVAITVTCPTCGEVNIVDETVDLSFAKCSSCGVILKDIPHGYNYLLIADEPHVAYEWFNSVVRKGVPGLCMSTTFPEKLRREYGLPDVELYWLSDTNPGPRTLDPRRLDFEIMRALSNYVKNNKGGAIVLDGLEYLIVENSFDRVLKFIKKVNDLSSVHDVTMFVPITPTGLGPEEATLLRKEFDKVETIPSK